MRRRPSARQLARRQRDHAGHGLVALFAYLLQAARAVRRRHRRGGWQWLATARLTNDLPEFAGDGGLLLAEAPERWLPRAARIRRRSPRTARSCFASEACASPTTSSPLPMVEHLLHASPASAARGSLSFRAALTEGQPGLACRAAVRVLEIGAGGASPGTAAPGRVAPRKTGVALAYHATNPDPEQAGRLALAVKSQAGASASCWSVTKPWTISRRPPVRV